MAPSYRTNNAGRRPSFRHGSGGAPQLMVNSSRMDSVVPPVMLIHARRDENNKRLKASDRTGSTKRQIKHMAENLQVQLYLIMSKSKTVKDARQQFQFLQRILSWTPKEQHNMVLTGAVATTVLAQHSRVQQLQGRLTQVVAFVLVPFALPPMLVIGIPALILLVPLVLLVWVLLALNRQARQVRDSARNGKRRNGRSTFTHGGVRKRIKKLFSAGSMVTVPTSTAAVAVMVAQQSAGRDYPTSSRPTKSSPRQLDAYTEDNDCVEDAPAPRSPISPSTYSTKERRTSTFKRMFVFGGNPKSHPLPCVEECSHASGISQTSSATRGHTNTSHPKSSYRLSSIQVEKHTPTARVPRTRRKSWIFGSTATTVSSATKETRLVVSRSY